jgi:thiosulfate dehydrogenase
MKMTRIGVYLLVAAAAAIVGLAACAQPAAPPPSNDSVARGGRLYDRWWNEVPGAVEPTGNQALWATQTTNERRGSATWRCKECHGWDYQGKDGAYATGSHFTVFTGVLTAGETKTVEELADILKGSSNSQHDFSSVVGSQDITDLANFLRNGLVDYSKYVDYTTGELISPDVSPRSGPA